MSAIPTPLGRAAGSRLPGPKPVVKKSNSGSSLAAPRAPGAGTATAGALTKRPRGSVDLEDGTAAAAARNKRQKTGERVWKEAFENPQEMPLNGFLLQKSLQLA